MKTPFEEAAPRDRSGLPDGAEREAPARTLSGRVLVVDDIEMNLRVAEHILASFKLTVETAMSGHEALEKVKSGNLYDIVFMDYMMPGMNGVETVKIMRALGYTHPIVALTASDVTGEEDMFLESGFDDAASKPIDRRQLSGKLKRFGVDISPEQAEPVPESRNGGLEDAAKRRTVSAMMARSFSRDAGKAAAALETLYENGVFGDEELRDIAAYAHGMKSALANVYEWELSDAAHAIEKAGRAKDVSAVSAGTPAFLKGLRAVMDRYAGKEDGDAEEYEAADFDHAHLREQLNAVIGACDRYDKRTIKAALSDLRQRAWPRPVGDRLDAMADQLLCGKFNEVSQIAKDIMGII
jgi:CheY-like chemotaxis protein